MCAKKVGIVSTFLLFPRGNLKNHTKEKLLPRTSSPKLFYMAKKFIFENVWCSTFIDELSTANILWWKKWIQFITILENIKWRLEIYTFFLIQKTKTQALMRLKGKILITHSFTASRVAVIILIKNTNAKKGVVVYKRK